MSSDSKSLRLKIYPWATWAEWLEVHKLLFGSMGIQTNREVNLLSEKHEGNLKKAYGIISGWLLKNVGGDQSKYLKMQRTLIVETLSMLRLARSDKEEEDHIRSDD